MNLAIPEADGATAAEVRDWLERFAACVREVDSAAARPFWHPDIIIFGMYQELLKSLAAWTEQQWDKIICGRVRRIFASIWRTPW